MFSTRDLGIGATIDVTNVPQTQKYIVAVLLGIAIWSSLEMLPIIYFTFTRYSGLYFWSMMVANLGVLVHATGFVLNNFQLTGNQTLPTVLTCTSWVAMVSAQSLVLYSRLHLINMSDTIRRLALGMIIFNGITLHTGTAITTIGSNSKSAQMFLMPYAIMERIQITIFFVQEFILSSLYVWKARGFLNWRRGRNSRSKAHQRLRLMMIHLILSNIIVLALDVTIIVLEYMGLYFLQVSYKAFVYAVKLKCEVGILNRLADFVKSASGGGYGAAAADNNNLLDGRDGGRRCFEDFHSFQLSSQVEREWETTLRNTFGVAMADEEKRDVVVVEERRHRHRRDDDDDDDVHHHHHHHPLPLSPDAALVAGARASSSSSSSGGRRRRGGGGGGGPPGPGPLETFGRDAAGGGRRSGDSLVGSLGGSDCSCSGPAGRRSTASSGPVGAADVVSVARSSSSLERPRQDSTSRPQASHMSGSVADG